MNDKERISENVFTVPAPQKCECPEVLNAKPGAVFDCIAVWPQPLHYKCGKPIYPAPQCEHDDGEYWSKVNQPPADWIKHRRKKSEVPVCPFCAPKAQADIKSNEEISLFAEHIFRWGTNCHSLPTVRYKEEKEKAIAQLKAFIEGDRDNRPAQPSPNAPQEREAIDRIIAFSGFKLKEEGICDEDREMWTEIRDTVSALARKERES